MRWHPLPGKGFQTMGDILENVDDRTKNNEKKDDENRDFYEP
jgi:hypothetical protein